MTAKIVIAIDDELRHAGVQLRKVQQVIRDRQMQTVAYVTMPVRSWASMRELFEEYDTGMAHYLFDELEEAQRLVRFYRNRAKVSLKVSDELKVENGLLQQRIERLERKIKKAERNT
jgi:hypothetical protein